MLKIFRHCHQCSSDGETRAIERMHEFVFAVRVAKASLHPACLKALDVRARRNLSKRVLRRQPDFEVIRLRRGKSDVGRAELDDET